MTIIFTINFKLPQDHQHMETEKIIKKKGQFYKYL